MKKRPRGRPPKDHSFPVEELPSWAIKRIQEISKDSGVDPRRIRDHALKSGLFEIRNKYDGLIESFKSADKLFNSSEQTMERDRPERVEHGTTPDASDEMGIPRQISEVSEPEIEGADQNGSADAAIERGFEPASLEVD